MMEHYARTARPITADPGSATTCAPVPLSTTWRGVAEGRGEVPEQRRAASPSIPLRLCASVVNP